MKLTNEYEINVWAYYQCLHGNDTKEIRDLIIHSYWIYLYCKDIRDIKEMWSRIIDPYYAKCYYDNVNKRLEVRKIWDK